jgi:hypothetical protein
MMDMKEYREYTVHQYTDLRTLCILSHLFMTPHALKCLFAPLLMCLFNLRFEASCWNLLF